MYKKIAYIVIAFLLVIAGIGLYKVYRQRIRVESTTVDKNIQIQALLDERSALEAQLEPRQAVPVVIDPTEDARVIATTLKEKSINGIIVFIDGQKPDDEVCLSSASLSDMKRAGWVPGVGVSREAEENEADWQNEVAYYTGEYHNILGNNISTYYYGTDAITAPEAAYLLSLGYTYVIAGEGSDVGSSDIKLITLYPYAINGIETKLLQTNGYAGLLMDTALDNENEDTRYSEENLALLLNNSRIILKGLNDLSFLTALSTDGSAASHDSTETIIARIAEIDAQLAALYK